MEERDSPVNHLETLTPRLGLTQKNRGQVGLRVVRIFTSVDSIKMNSRAFLSIFGQLIPVICIQLIPVICIFGQIMTSTSTRFSHIACESCKK